MFICLHAIFRDARLAGAARGRAKWGHWALAHTPQAPLAAQCTARAAQRTKKLPQCPAQCLSQAHGAAHVDGDGQGRALGSARSMRAAGGENLAHPTLPRCQRCPRGLQAWRALRSAGRGPPAQEYPGGGDAQGAQVVARPGRAPGCCARAPRAGHAAPPRAPKTWPRAKTRYTHLVALGSAVKVSPRA